MVRPGCVDTGKVLVREAFVESEVWLVGVGQSVVDESVECVVKEVVVAGGVQDENE